MPFGACCLSSSWWASTSVRHFTTTTLRMWIRRWVTPLISPVQSPDSSSASTFSAICKSKRGRRSPGMIDTKNINLYIYITLYLTGGSASPHTPPLWLALSPSTSSGSTTSHRRKYNHHPHKSQSIIEQPKTVFLLLFLSFFFSKNPFEETPQRNAHCRAKPGI